MRPVSATRGELNKLLRYAEGTSGGFGQETHETYRFPRDFEKVGTASACTRGRMTIAGTLNGTGKV